MDVLEAVQPPVALGGQQLTYEVRPHLVQLYVANVEARWHEEAGFRTAMEVFGRVERCHVMRNAKGQSKVGSPFSMFQALGSVGGVTQCKS